MWPNQQKIVDLVTFTEKILNEKLHFFHSGNYVDDGIKREKNREKVYQTRKVHS